MRGLHALQVFPHCSSQLAILPLVPVWEEKKREREGKLKVQRGLIKTANVESAQTRLSNDFLMDIWRSVTDQTVQAGLNILIQSRWNSLTHILWFCDYSAVLSLVLRKPLKIKPKEEWHCTDLFVLLQLNLNAFGNAIKREKDKHFSLPLYLWQQVTWIRSIFFSVLSACSVLPLKRTEAVHEKFRYW